MEIEKLCDERTRKMIYFENEFSKLMETYAPIFQEVVKKQLDDTEKIIYSIGMK